MRRADICFSNPRYLHLNPYLRGKSGVLLGSALAHNHTLEWLDVSYNAIGEEGAQAIGTALAVSKYFAFTLRDSTSPSINEEVETVAYACYSSSSFSGLIQTNQRP